MCCMNRTKKEIIESVIVAIYYATEHWKQCGKVWENRKDVKNINGTNISIPYNVLTFNFAVHGCNIWIVNRVSQEIYNGRGYFIPII